MGSQCAGGGLDRARQGGIHPGKDRVGWGEERKERGGREGKGREREGEGGRGRGETEETERGSASRK